MKYTCDEIYKMYKHGCNFMESVTANQVYKALKVNGLQPVIVKDINNKKLIWVYIPEKEEFNQIY